MVTPPRVKPRPHVVRVSPGWLHVLVELSTKMEIEEDINKSPHDDRTYRYLFVAESVSQILQLRNMKK